MELRSKPIRNWDQTTRDEKFMDKTWEITEKKHESKTVRNRKETGKELRNNLE